MTRYRFDIYLFLVFVSLHLGASVYQKSRGDIPLSIFPFFSWDLFVDVPVVSMRKAILIEEIDGFVLNPVRDLRDYWRPLRRHDPSNSFPIPSQLNNAIKRGDQKEVERIKESIRTRYFSGARWLKYSLVDLSFDPIEAWKDRSKVGKRVIAEFSFGKKDSVEKK